MRTARWSASCGRRRTPGSTASSWDLRYEAPRLVALRTTPPENPHIWEEPRFRGQDTRPVTHWGLEPAQVGPIVAPGKYTVKLTVDGQTFTQPIEILKDPKIPTIGRRSRCVGAAAAADARRHHRRRPTW